jgi:hypothetical protein
MGFSSSSEIPGQVRDNPERASEKQFGKNPATADPCPLNLARFPALRGSRTAVSGRGATP